MRPWHWIFASVVSFTAVPALAQKAPAAQPARGGDRATATETNKSDPSAKAARCAGKRGAEHGCTGYLPSLRPSAAAQRRAKSDNAPRTPDLDWSVINGIRLDTPLQRQSERLLMLEIGRLERLLNVTPRNAPDRAQLVRRIADSYAELAAIAARRQIVAEEKVREAERANKSSRGR